MASFTDIPIGMVCAGGAVWSAHDSFSLRRHGAMVEGVVVGKEHHLEIASDGFGFTHAPIVEFRPAAGGAIVRFRSSVWTAWSGYDKGDKVSVRYLADRPDDARIDSVWRDALLPLSLSVLGLGAFAGKLRTDRSRTLFSKRWED